MISSILAEPSLAPSHSTETSATYLTPSASLDSNNSVRNPNYNPAPAQDYNPHLGETFLVYGNNPVQGAPHTSQWHSRSPFQVPPPSIPPHCNFLDVSSVAFNPLNDRRFTGGPRVNIPMPGLPEPQRRGGLFYPETTRDAGYETKHTNNGGPINWQPWRQPPTLEPGVETCSNVAVACEGDQNQQDDAVIGLRMMDFQNEFEKSRYIGGLGLPAEGDSPEARLLRALNMSHYILIEHMDKAQKEMKQYVCSTVNKVADHTQNSLGRKFHLLERQIAKLSKERADSKPLEPSSTALPGEAARPSPHYPVDLEEDNHSLQHLEIAILKLWSHIDKIKNENHLHKEEKSERKEIEELLAGELLYHNRTMEKMKAKINSMSTEVSSCWKEIYKLQDAMKELEDGAFPRGLTAVKPTPAKSCVREYPQTPVTPVGVVPDPQELLQKINEELEYLGGRHREKRTQQERFWDECSCDLCGKARAGKSAGVAMDHEHYGRNSEEEDSKGKGKERATGEEISVTHLGMTERKTTVGDYLAALNLTILDHTVVTNVTPTSPIPQKWRDVYNRSIQGNQRMLEFMRPNGDVVILLIQPNEGVQKLGRRGYGLNDEEPGSPAVGGNSPGINSLEVICPPGPYPRTLEEAFAAIGHPLYHTSDDSFDETALLSNIRRRFTDPVSPKLPVNAKSQVQLFAPYSHVAKCTLPGAELNAVTPFHEADATIKDARKPQEEPMKVIERTPENMPYYIHRQMEAEADIMQRPADILSFVNEALFKIRDYEVSMKEFKTRVAAERALHSGGGMYSASASHLYPRADTTPKSTSSPKQTGPKPVEVEEVSDDPSLPSGGDEKGGSVDGEPTT
ncbi:hypothetical protein BGX38DRAFT_1266702 [Terfezia claveryi]|nr:hypothetical protein BGX38DRAFT_1266702 [Terfezia claveryi]